VIPFLFLRRELRRAWRNDHAAQIVEFAVSLPLLVLFVVGIFDFSSAFTLKQKLTNAARDAARTAAADPANDLANPTNPLPASVSDAFQEVDNYLLANKVNDCGITASSVPVLLTWTFTANGNGCPAGGITVIINRGYVLPASGTTTLPTVGCAPPSVRNQTAIVSTCVSIQYAYQWTFGRVAGLFGNNTLPATISAVAVAMNEN